jgi:hypothetical protein
MFFASFRSFSLRSVSVLALALAAAPVACSVSADDGAAMQSSAIRPMTNAEALADFDQLTGSFRSLYGAMERKEERYGFTFDALVSEYRARVAASRTEPQYQAIFQEFIARFEDAHVSLSAPLLSDDAHAFRLPLGIMPVEDTFVVYNVAASIADRVRVGDELVSLDGKAPSELIERFAKFVGTPNALAARHMATARLTSRPFFASEGLRAGSTATLRLRGANGVERDVVLPWSEVPRLLPPLAPLPKAGESRKGAMMARSEMAEEVTRAELARMGSRVPFFMTAPVAVAIHPEPVAPSASALEKFGVTAEAAASIDYFAARYELEGKRVLLVRLPSYTPPDEDAALGYLRALFDEQQPLVDALVFDQTHNPGGSLFFALGVASLLTPRPIHGFVQANHADRTWIHTFASIANDIRQSDPTNPLASVLEDQARKIDAAYSAGKSLSEPLPPFSDTTTLDPDAAHWNKPAIMLIDELAVSCGDIVPLLLKANHVVPLFGQGTMGGGGNVEEVATLTNSRWSLNLSRGLGTVFDPTGVYPDVNFIEDNGVVPDVAYTHSLADFRAGYVGYVNAFNAALGTQLGRR